MDESAGSTRVDSVNAYNLTDHATVGSAAAMFGNGAVFASASSQYLSRANGSDLTTGDEDVSWSCWVNFGGSLPSVNQSIFARRAGNGTVNYQLYWQNNGGQRRFLWTYGVNTAVSSQTISANTWYFVSCNHDSVNNTINIRVNGTTTDSTSDSGFDIFLPVSSEFDVGTDSSNQFLDGTVDDLVFMRGYVFTDADHDLAYASGTGVAFSSWGGGGGGVTVGADALYYYREHIMRGTA